MRKLEELTAADFPHCEPQKFEQWKEARIQANRNLVGILVGLVLLNLLLYAATRSIILGGVALWLVIVISERKPGRLWRELGLTRQLVREARSRAGAPPSDPSVSAYSPVPTAAADVATLRAGLHSPDAVLRKQCASLLGDRGAAAVDALPELEPLESDSDRGVRNRAQWAVENIRRKAGV